MISLFERKIDRLDLVCYTDFPTECNQLAELNGSAAAQDGSQWLALVSPNSHIWHARRSLVDRVSCFDEFCFCICSCKCPMGWCFARMSMVVVRLGPERADILLQLAILP